MLLVPTIRIEPRPLGDEVATALRELATYQLVVFTSANAVRVFAGYLARGTEDGGMPPGPSVAAVGPATAAALEKHGLACHLVPDEYVAEGLLDAFEEQAAPWPAPVSSSPVPATPATCSPRRCASGEPWSTCCTSTTRSPPASSRCRRLRVEAADYITFTSASTATRSQALWRLLTAGRGRRRREAARRSGSPAPGSAPSARSPARALRDLGLPVAVEAREYTAAGLVAAIAAGARARCRRAHAWRDGRRRHTVSFASTAGAMAL